MRPENVFFFPLLNLCRIEEKKNGRRKTGKTKGWKKKRKEGKIKKRKKKEGNTAENFKKFIIIFY